MILISNEKKNKKFLNLCGLSTESFLAIGPSQYKFLIKKCHFKVPTVKSVLPRGKFYRVKHIFTLRSKFLPWGFQNLSPC